MKKNQLNQLKFLKNRPVRFSFISLKLKKPNRIQTEKNPEKNRAKSNRTETGRFEPVSIFLKNFSLINFFFIKTEPKQKIITPT